MEFRLKERRGFPRIRLNSPLRYKIRGSNRFIDTINSDISLGGISFSSKEFIPPKTPISLEVNLASRILNPIAKVVWSVHQPHAEKYQLGLEFLEFNALEKNHLSDYIDMQTNKL